MESAGKSLLRSSGLRAAPDDLGRGQKLRAAAGQRAALAGAFPENLLKRRRDSTCAVQLARAALHRRAKRANVVAKEANIRERRMRLFSARRCMLTAASMLVGIASADPYRWCAVDSVGGGTNCGFVTIEQCRATISGVGGSCEPKQVVPTGLSPAAKAAAH